MKSFVFFREHFLGYRIKKNKHSQIYMSIIHHLPVYVRKQIGNISFLSHICSKQVKVTERN